MNKLILSLGLIIIACLSLVFGYKSMALFEGDMNVTGTSFVNIPYGGMWYDNDTATLLNFAQASTYYPLFFTQATHLNGFTFQGGFMRASNLTAQHDGTYLACYMAAGDGQNNHVYVTTILINSIPQLNCEGRHKMAAGEDIITQSGCCFIDIKSGDKIQLATKDMDSTGTGNYFSANIDLIRVGS